MTSFRYSEYPRETFVERLIKSNCAEMNNRMAMRLRIAQLERINSWEFTVGEQGEMDMLNERLKNKTYDSY